MLRVGDFLNKVIFSGVLRDGQALNIFFTELLPFCITPQDRAYLKNVTTFLDFLRSIKEEKLADIKKGKVGYDLFSILLNEGEDIYGMFGSNERGEKAMLDDVSLIYLAGVSTT